MGGNTSFVLPAALSASACVYFSCATSFSLLLCIFEAIVIIVKMVAVVVVVVV